MATEIFASPLAFELAALALLAAPGPTNTLLATSGASSGLRSSAHLLVAEVLGYAIAVAALVLVVGPLAASSRALGIGLRLGCGLFLLYAAWRLWRQGSVASTGDLPVKFRDVLLATMLNPKALVLAFLIAPASGRPGETTWVLGTALVAVAAILTGGAWIAIGASLRASARFGAGAARRAGALVLGFFALLIAGSSFTS